MDSISSRRGPRPEVDTCSQDRDSQETAMQALLLQGPPCIRWACKVQQRQALQDKSRGTAWVAMTVAAGSNKQVKSLQTLQSMQSQALFALHAPAGELCQPKRCPCIHQAHHLQLCTDSYDSTDTRSPRAAGCAQLSAAAKRTNVLRQSIEKFLTGGSQLLTGAAH